MYHSGGIYKHRILTKICLDFLFAFTDYINIKLEKKEEKHVLDNVVLLLCHSSGLTPI